MEIGLVYGSGSEIEGEWSTTINPQRDVTASDIHGLRGADVMDSPTFQDIAGSLLSYFEGRIPIAHNAAFDRAFFDSELARAGIPQFSAEWFCTLKAMSNLGIRPTSLDACCAACEIPMPAAHEALVDARACAALVIHEYSNIADDLALVTPFTQQGGPFPASSPRPRSATNRGAARNLSQLAIDLPDAAGMDSDAAQAYMDLLVRVLEDRRVTPEEFEALRISATELGLTKPSLESIHRAYLGALHSKFTNDGVLTPAESRDLSAVEELLGVTVSDSLTEPEAQTKVRVQADSIAGSTVCFTGEIESTITGEAISRARAQALATDAGLIVKSGVSKKLDLLVVVDPSSLSGKARKARELGVRVLAEKTFWDAIGVEVD